MIDQIIQIVSYGTSIIIVLLSLYYYVYKQRRESKEVEVRIEEAKEAGRFEPVSLYPVMDDTACLSCGACAKACLIGDVIGYKKGKAVVVNATHCIGCGGCFRACPQEGITLWLGTEKRGVDLPQVSTTFETNVTGIYIAGELGGMGLISNAVRQGEVAVSNIAASLKKSEVVADYDLIIVGAGPAGISASLEAKRLNLKTLTVEHGSLGGTVFTYPRSKIVMTSPMNLPLYGKVKLTITNKMQLLDLWHDVLTKNKITIHDRCTVKSIVKKGEVFSVDTAQGEHFTTKKVLLAIGRGGTPRKLDIPGEESEKVTYRLLEPDEIIGKKIVVVGGGGAAVEAALLLMKNNSVTISFRGEVFSRVNLTLSNKLKAAIEAGQLTVLYKTNVVAIEPDAVKYVHVDTGLSDEIENELVYIFVGGELPTQLLRDMGIDITTTHGRLVMNH